mmetsp:Transcript_9344/g.22501  ORF Transcript_9344/g.22501 Transcript_9344/m.22501 type:complete len:204 (-) Transcript_9344:360-971(-)
MTDAILPARRSAGLGQPASGASSLSAAARTRSGRTSLRGRRSWAGCPPWPSPQRWAASPRQLRRWAACPRRWGSAATGSCSRAGCWGALPRERALSGSGGRRAPCQRGGAPAGRLRRSWHRTRALCAECCRASSPCQAPLSASAPWSGRREPPPWCSRAGPRALISLWSCAGAPFGACFSPSPTESRRSQHARLACPSPCASA